MAKVETAAPQFTHCPYCDGNEFIEVEQTGYGAVTRRGGWRGTGLIHTVCLGCGGVIHTRVMKVSALLSKSEREAKKA